MSAREREARTASLEQRWWCGGHTLVGEGCLAAGGSALAFLDELAGAFFSAGSFLFFGAIC